MSDGREAFDLEGKYTCFAESQKAIRVTPKGRVGVPFWVPKAVLHDDSEVYTTREIGKEGKLVVHRWWAEDNGIS